MNTKLNMIVCALAVTAALGFTGSAVAQDSTSAIPSEVVHYSDLNLSTAAGVHSLYERIQDASMRVCRHISPVGVLNLKCRAALAEAAVADVNSPALTALQTGKAPTEMTAQR